MKSYETGSREIRDTVVEVPVDMPGTEVETVAGEEAFTVEQCKGRGLCQKVR
ncbi:MAG: hypothetical protein ACJ8BW_07000 [Ktedonobacteraceae bacterium]